MARTQYCSGSKYPKRKHVIRRSVPTFQEYSDISDDEQILPVPCPTRQYGLPVQPCRNAIRFYRPAAKARIQEERRDQLDDLKIHPSDQAAKLLDGTVDPVLHIGNFNPSDIKWQNGGVPRTIL